MSEYKTLNTIAYEHLRRMIYSGELQFRKIYSETKLARELSVSRTPMRDALMRHGIPILPHTARQTVRADYPLYDYIICMDYANMNMLDRIYGGDPEGKISLLLTWAGEIREVADPWYTWDFDKAISDITRGCAALKKALKI